MNLYYNFDKNCFSLNEDGNSKKVFETHSRVGFDKTTIEEGRFKLEIHTNFYPKRPQKAFLRANLFVYGIKLLPVSESFRIPISQIHFNLHEISFKQYGAGENNGREPSTFFLRKDLDWYKLLESICKASEQPEEWQRRQFNLLLAKLEEQGLFIRTPVLLGRLLEIYAPYEKILGTDMYSKLLPYSISVMYALLDKMNKEGVNSCDKSWLKYCDIIWKCLKINIQDNS